MIDSPEVLWVLLPAFLPTPTEGVQLSQTTWSCSLLSDTWHILIYVKRRASSGLKIPIWLNMIKILRCSKAEACWLNNHVLEMLNKAAVKWRMWCFDALILDRHQCQNSCALSRCQQTSSGDGGRTLFAFSPTVSVLWHLFPPRLILVWVVLTGIADEHMQKRTQLPIHTIREWELEAQNKEPAAPTFLTALTFNELCAKLHTWCGLTID